MRCWTFLLLLNLALFDLLAFKILALTELFELLILFLFQLRIDVVVVTSGAHWAADCCTADCYWRCSPECSAHCLPEAQWSRQARDLHLVVLLLLNIAVVLLRDIAIVLLLDIAIVEIWGCPFC